MDLFDETPTLYTYSFKTRLQFWLALAGITALGFWSVAAVGWGSGLVWGLVWLAAAVYTLRNEDTIRTDSDGLTQRRLLFPEVRLRWEELVSLRASDLDAGVSIQGKGARIEFSARLAGYSDLVEQVLRRRPDLFQKRFFRLLGGIRLASIALALILAALTLFALSDGSYGAAGVLAAAAAGLGWIYLSRPLWLRLEDDGLRIGFGLTKRMVLCGEILTIRLRAEQARRTEKLAGVEVVLRDNKVLSLTGFEGGEAYLYCTLQHWLEQRAAARLGQFSQLRPS